ncbi:deoxyribonuclease IV [bacterium]|nr:deoxyribonuclease IV [candidate division CSSED10-310 bacterium]
MAIDTGSEPSDSSPTNPAFEYLFGSHLSVAGGPVNAVLAAKRLALKSLSIFLASPRVWHRTLPDADLAVLFRRQAQSAGLVSVIMHALYLANPASPRQDLLAQTIDAVTTELTACHILGIPWLVLHPGACRGSGIASGIRRVAQTLDACFESVGSCSAGIALETTAGTGTTLGGRFDHLRDIIGTSRYSDRLSICLDTCHIFVAGYDLRTSEAWAITREQIERTVGLHRIRVIHLNDTPEQLGSQRDRHTHIGQGHIGREGFRHILLDPICRTVPMILETPKDNTGSLDRMNIAELKAITLL